MDNKCEILITITSGKWNVKINGEELQYPKKFSIYLDADNDAWPRYNVEYEAPFPFTCLQHIEYIKNGESNQLKG